MAGRLAAHKVLRAALDVGVRGRRLVRARALRRAAAEDRRARLGRVLVALALAARLERVVARDLDDVRGEVEQLEARALAEQADERRAGDVEAVSELL